MRIEMSLPELFPTKVMEHYGSGSAPLYLSLTDPDYIWRMFIHKRMLEHGLITYINIKEKCRHLKKLTCKGTLRQVFIRIYTGDTVGHVGIIDPALWIVALLTISLVQHLPPLPCVKCLLYYTYTACKRGGEGFGILGLRQINTCRKVPLQFNFLIWRHFLSSSMSPILLHC
jgi:hypothetical protein